MLSLANSPTIISKADKMFFERCCTCAEDALAALHGKAGRVELCECLEVGGVTPSAENIRETVAVGLPVNVLVRPRGGDFVYSEEELEEMLSSIELCRSLGVSGIVAGALRDDGSVDMNAMRRLVAAARGEDGQRSMSFTFHRAFDEAADPFATLEDVISLGCDRLLTSGQQASAMEGADLIAGLVNAARGRITVMPGAGVTPLNVEQLAGLTGAGEFHGTKLY